MPQTTNEHRARWPGGDAEATKFLTDAGYRLTLRWTWKRPLDPSHKRKPTTRELDAIAYLIHEWDYDCLEPSDPRES